MVEINSYYDDIIDGDNADPAYAAIRDIPFAVSPTESEFAPTTDPRPVIDLDTQAFLEFNKLIDRAVLPQYQMATGKTLEENFGKDILGRQLSLAQAFGEAGLPLDSNKESATSAELQDPVIGPLLQKYGYKPQSASEGLERTVETFLRAQRDAREKRLRGEKLTPMEEIDASLPMALLDAFDFTGLVGLGLKGAFKASRASLKYLLGEAAKGTPKDVALKKFAELYPEDTKALQMSAVQEEKAKIGGGSGIPPVNPMDNLLGDNRTVFSPDKNGVGGSGKSEEPKKLGIQDEKIQKAKDELDEIKSKQDDPNYKFTGQEIKQVIKKQNPEATDNAIERIQSGRRKIKGKDTVTDPFKEYRIGTVGTGSRSPAYFQRQAIPDKTKGSPSFQYINKKAKEYYDKFGKRPQPSDLILFIKQTDPQGAALIKNTGQIDEILTNQRKVFELPPEEIFIKPKKLLSIQNTIDDMTKRIPGFESDYQLFLQSLRNDIGKFSNPIKKNFNTYLDSYTNSFGEKIFNYDSMTNFLRENAQRLNVPRRLFTLENINYPPTFFGKRSGEIANAERQVQSRLQGGAGKNPRVDLQDMDLPVGTPMNNFLSMMYRGMLAIRPVGEKGVLRKGLLPTEEFIKKYVEPYKGATREETIENLKRQYPEFAEWEKMEKKYDRFNELVDGLLSDLDSLGVYTPQQMEEFAMSLRPNRSHRFPLSINLVKGRLTGMAQNAKLIDIQPAVYNKVYQPAFDDMFAKVLKELEKKGQSIEKLKSTKAKNIKTPANSAGFDPSFSEFQARFPNPEDQSQYNYLTFIINQIDAGLKEKGLTSVMSFNPRNKQILKGLRFQDENFVGPPGGFDFKEVGEVLILGTDPRRKPSPEFYLSGALRIIQDALQQGRVPKKTPKSKKKGALKGQTNFMLLNEGGPVRMAIGGDPLQNINQQQFAPDPAFEGQDFFQEAVDSGNLTAFNPLKLFKVFNKVKGTATKADIGQPTTLPRADQAVPVVEESDFPFKSFTYEKLQSPNAPGAARPQDWANYLTGGDTAPISEIRDSGLEQFLRDYEKYYPNQKLSKQQIVDYFETSPTGNLEMRVKGNAKPDLPDQGRTRHMNAGNQPLDNQGTNYREVIVQAGPIPGEGQPFINSSHFSEPNVIAFTRVADYQLADGSTAAVIQELQTDMLNTVRVEQLRIKTLLDRLKLTDQKARDILNNPASTPDQVRQAQQTIDKLAQQVSPEQRALLEQTQGIKPFPNAAGASLIPGYTDEILKLQDNVNDLLRQKKAANQPFIDQDIFDINQRQLVLRDQLLDLNRSLEIDQNLKGIPVPNADQADELRSLSQRPIENFDYERTNDIQLFPPIPFTKTADYVDLIIKATIKDAQSRGINRVGIFTGELVNKRWGKDPTGPAGKKFNDLYSKVSVQQMNNIAKKYGGQVIEGAIINSSKPEKGLKLFNKSVEGNFELLREFAPTNRRVDEFLDEEILRIVEDYGPNDIVVKREIAPGQTMEFYASKQDEGLQLTPLGDADRAENATIIIEEYNPQLVKIPVLVLEEAEKAKGPFFLYRKKDGGKIASDGLVSITDIYGDY